ncbi:MAG: NlpC/P60 family protein [Sphingomonadaceae bacterium]
MTARTSRINGPRRFGPLEPLDRRLAAWRPGLADIALADLIAASNYASPVQMRLGALSAPLLAAPAPDATMVSELLHGEGFAVLDRAEGWAWGYCLADHYVGYVAVDALVMPADEGNEARIGPGDGLLFARPSIKATTIATLPMGAVIDWHPHDEQFVQIASGPYAGRFLHRRHLLPEGADRVDLALHFLGAPYRWGGRSRAGVDCSGLVQVASQLSGQPLRRDTDMQAADIQARVATASRGDLAWWPGHIGIMLDETRLLHANARWMRCVIEPLADVIARAGGDAVLLRPQTVKVARKSTELLVNHA